MTKEEAINNVLTGMQVLICMGAKATAHRYFAPQDPDSDSDVMESGRLQVATLRKLREEFEDLMLSGNALHP